MPGAGALNFRMALQQRAADENGDRLGDWETQATYAAAVRNLRGTEPVIGQRLQGIQPAVITLRASSLTRQIDNAWRLVDARNGDVWAIQTAVISDDRAWIELTCTRGRASDG